MDTIEKHKWNLIEEFAITRTAVDKMESAKELARVIVSNSLLLTPHKKKMLSEVVWLVSLVNGKYTTRYRSKTVVDEARIASASSEVKRDAESAKINHEHVISRKEIVNRMLDQPDEAARILDSCRKLSLPDQLLFS